MTSFEFTDEEGPLGVAVLAVRGELDVFTAPELRARLAEHVALRPAGIVVDLSRCEFVDASGCRVLLAAARRLATEGGRLAIVAPAGSAARTFAVMGLADLFPVAPTRAAAAAIAVAPPSERERDKLLL